MQFAAFGQADPEREPAEGACRSAAASLESQPAFSTRSLGMAEKPGASQQHGVFPMPFFKNLWTSASTLWPDLTSLCLIPSETAWPNLSLPTENRRVLLPDAPPAPARGVPWVAGPLPGAPWLRGHPCFCQSFRQTTAGELGFVLSVTHSNGVPLGWVRALCCPSVTLERSWGFLSAGYGPPRKGKNGFGSCLYKDYGQECQESWFVAALKLLVIVQQCCGGKGQLVKPEP